MSIPSSTTHRSKSVRLFARQRELLELLDAHGGDLGNKDYQKLLFLYCQELGDRAPYEFVPYKLGAFSFTSYADRRKLVERGLLRDDAYRWRITAAGRKAMAGDRGRHLAVFAHKYRNLRGDRLIAETYRRFPYYAGRSEVADRVLAGDDEALRRIEAARPRPESPSPLATIGYEGVTLESYLNRLLRAGITILCDVRKNPISRKYGFSKGTLSRSCEGVGIRYEQLRELGIESTKRQRLETQADYDALFAEYARTTLTKQGAALSRIREWIDQGERVALTCYEKLPQQCHRSLVADAVARGFGRGRRRGVQAVHL